MFKSTRTVAVAAAVSLISSFAVANDLGVADPLAVGASVYGSSDVVTVVTAPGVSRAQTVAPVEAVSAATPLEGDALDMSGIDGTLRACYAAGGMAKQKQDLSYFCTYDVASSSPATQTQSAYIAPAHVDTGYNGTSNVQDEALVDCVERGGSLIQLASNGLFACAM